MNTTTLKLLFLLGVVSCILLEVNARAVEQPWEVDDYNDDHFQDYDDGYEREVRQPLRYGKRRTMGKLSDTNTFNKGPHMQPPPYRYNSQQEGK